VFDSNGVFLRTIGQKGQGPGEIGQTGSLVIGSGDTLVVEAGARRIGIFGPEGEPARDLTLRFGSVGCLHQSGNRAVLLRNGRLLLSASVSTPEYAGIPLYVTDDRGDLMHAFGTPNTATLGTLSCRLLALGANRLSVWIAEPKGYRLEQRLITEDASFPVVRVLGVKAPWLLVGQAPFMTPAETLEAFEKGKKRSSAPQSHEAPAERPEFLQRAPETLLRGLSVDSEDRLWLVWQAPARGWDTVRTKYAHRDELLLSSGLNDRLWETIVDVIDTKTGVLRLRTKFPFHAHLAAPGFIAHPFYSGLGEPEVRIWSISLRAP
jgi:hypothetical protein